MSEALQPFDEQQLFVCFVDYNLPLLANLQSTCVGWIAKINACQRVRELRKCSGGA